MAGDVAFSTDPHLAGVGVLSGAPIRTWDPAHVAGQHVFLSHGTHDGIFPLTLAHETRDDLIARGAHVTYFEFDGGHELGPIVDPLVDFLERVTHARALHESPLRQ